MAYFPENSEDWKKIASLIESSETIYISSHINPDGDAIGSEMAFAHYLRNMKKKCRVINHSATPDMYKFLDPESIIESLAVHNPPKNGPGKNDLVIILDLINYKRLGDVADFLVKNEAKKIIIDHHVPEPIDADIAVVNTNASSTGALLYDFFSSTDISFIDKNVAVSLLTSIVTDTGYFSYSNTTPTTHLIASSLYKHGVTTMEVSKQIKTTKPLSSQRLLGLTLARTEVTDCGRIGYSYITQSMFGETGANRDHTENIINHIRIIKDIKLAILFIEEKNNSIKISLRSPGKTTVHKIAKRLGGGGHKKAAGAHIDGAMEEVISSVLHTVLEMLDEDGE